MSKTKTAAPKKVAATKTTATTPAAAPAKKAASKAAAPAKAAAKKAAVKKAAPATKAAVKKAAAPAKKAAAAKTKAPAKKAAVKKAAPAKKTAAPAATTAARKAESVQKPAAAAKTAAKQPWSHSAPGTLAALKAVANALLDKKASDLRILHLGNRSSLTDFIVIATGLAETHLRALHIESEKAFDLLKYPIIGIDRQTDSGWVVVDAADIMVHIFTEEKRGYYALESNWKDAEIVTLAQLA